MFKKKKIVKKEQTFKEFVKDALISNGLSVKSDNEDRIAIWGLLDLDKVSKEIVEYIHKTPIDKLFPQMEIIFRSVDTGYCDSN